MNKPAAYIISILFSFSVLVAIWSALFFYQLGLPTRLSYWTNALVSNKLLAADNAKDSKIVFVAGSSGNFNIDAERISNLTDIQSVNLGTHAILPLEYMLDHTKKSLHKGDTVVLALEYLYFAVDDRLNESYLNYLLARDPKYFKELPLSDQIEIMSHVSLTRLLSSIKESLLPTEPSYAFNVYSEFFYSPYGDSHSNNLIFLNKDMRDQRAKALIEPSILSISGSKYNWKLLKNFAEWCKSNDVLLLAVPPATLKFSVYDDSDHRKALATLKVLYQEAGINFVGDPYEVMYDRPLFFDTNYHSNAIGKRAYTDTLVSWIKPYLGNQAKRSNVIAATETPVDKALHSFNGWMPLSGLLPLEGPYPERNIPVVAWGAPQTRLEVNAPNDGIAEFKIEFLQNLDTLPVTVLLDGVQIFSKEFKKSVDFQKAELTFKITRGLHVITINSSESSTSETGISLLLKTIYFTPPAAAED